MDARVRRVSWSVSEIVALAARAARGAGAPPGQAAQFGRAAARHLAQARDPEMLVDALKALPRGAILDVPLALDEAVEQAAPQGCARIDAQAPVALVQSYVDTLAFEAQLNFDSGLMLDVNTRAPRAAEGPARVVGQDGLIEFMERLAARTYVPESDVSRQKGAGAGISDND